MNKKLQVFVSSTYTDLIEERQSAVEAILDAGHIPAGMELFKAGNESQLKTIYKWIDNSDVYMLILGGRYGSIEPSSGKSYTQLEYEYAISKNIPIFAVVLSDDFLTKKINTLGLDKVMQVSSKYQEFKDFVMSKIVKIVDDCKDIKLAIHSTLNEFLNEYELIGWVRNTSENDSLQLLTENNKLIKENNSLNKQIQKLTDQLNSREKTQLGDFSYDELVKILKKKNFTLPPTFTNTQKEQTLDALAVFISLYNIFVTGVSNKYGISEDIAYIFFHVAPYYISFGLLEKVKLTGTTAQRIQTTKIGSSFYAMLEANGVTKI